MTTKTTSFKRKLIVGAVLGLLLWFLLPVGVVFAYPQGNYLTEENIISYDSEDLLFLDFKAKTTFSISWHKTGADYCEQTLIGYDPKLFPVSSGLSPVVQHLLSDLALFEENGSFDCVKTETFTAGITYRAYFLNSKTITTISPTKAWIKENVVSKFSEENLIPDTTVITIYNIYDSTVYEDTPY
ncbi:unnamed protein product, partial [marine sediment metagenome]